MTRSLAALCLLAASVPALPAADQEKPVDKGFSLRGKVVDGVSGRPIRDVELRLSDNHWQPAADAIAADAQGRFVFSGLAAGEYILSAESPDTGAVFFDELPEPGIVQTIRIKPEERERTVLFRIMPRTAIGGTVRDEFGDPVHGAVVTFHRPAWVDGRIVLEQVQQIGTDDRGRYRAGRLPPGGYVVCAAAGLGGPGAPLAPIAGTVDFESRHTPRVYAETCYPGSGGSPPAVLDVRAGRQAEVNLSLLPVAAASVRGHLLNLPPGTSAQMRLVRDLDLRNQQPLFTGAAPDGAFAFHGVLPGSYRLEADVSLQDHDGTRIALTARLPIDVGGGNLEAIEVPFEPAAVIDVVLHNLDGEKAPPEGVNLGLRPAVGSTWNTPWAQSEPPGALRFGSVAPGSYRLVTRTSETTCIESAIIGEHDVLHAPLTVTPGMTARLDVTVSKDCGQIDVRVVHDDEPVPGAKVILLLSGSPKQPVDLMADFADEQGEVRYFGLAPGRYRLWAWRVDAFGSFLGPAALDATPEQSVEIRMARGKHVTIEVPLMRQEGPSR